MEAGVLEYQLCPLHYNCDNCEIHRKLTAHLSSAEEHPDKPAAYIPLGIPDDPQGSFEAGYQYLPCYLWLKHIAKDRVQVGLHPFMWQFLPPLEKTLLAREGRHIQPGACMFWLHFQGGMICCRSPIEGAVLARNEGLDGAILNPLALQYGSAYENWLLTLQTADLDPERLQVMSRIETLERVQRHRRLLVRLARSPEYNRAISEIADPHGSVLKKLITPKLQFAKLLKKLTDQVAFVC